MSKKETHHYTPPEGAAVPITFPHFSKVSLSDFGSINVVPSFAIAASITAVAFHFFGDRDKHEPSIRTYTFTFSRLALTAWGASHLQNVSFFVFSGFLCRNVLFLLRNTSERSLYRELEEKKTTASLGKHRAYEIDGLIIAAEHVVYVALAIFSTSRLTFALLSAASLYTFYQASRSHFSLTLKKSGDEKRFRYTYQATFPLKHKTTPALLSHLKQFKEAFANIKPVNKIQNIRGTYHVYVEQIPPLSQLSFSVKNHNGISQPTQTISLECYKPGVTIASITLVKFDQEDNQTASAYLDDGTLVYFPNVQFDVCKDLIESKQPIAAQIVSKTIKEERIVLECSSNVLPSQRKITISRTFPKRELQITACLLPAKELCTNCSDRSAKTYYVSAEKKHALCQVCIKTHFEQELDNIKIVNPLFDCIYALQETYPKAPHQQALFPNSTIIASHKNQPLPITWLDYQLKTKVLLQIERFETSSQTAYGELKDGTHVSFPNVPSHLATTLIQNKKIISARVVSSSVREGRLHLECASTALPQEGNASVERSVQGKTLAISAYLLEAEGPCFKCQGSCATVYHASEDAEHPLCQACMTTHLGDALEKIAVVNSSPTQIKALLETYPKDPSLKPLFSQTKVWAWLGVHPTAITWLDYQPSQTLKVQVMHFSEGKWTAYTKLKDETLVCFLNVPPYLAQKVIESKEIIKAQIISKRIVNGRLQLICSSDALIPQTKTVSMTRPVSIFIKFIYQAIFIPKPFKKGEAIEDCPLCLETPEQPYYTCSNGHTQCEACLTALFQNALKDLRTVNESVFTGSTYRFCIEKDNLPKCPCCRTPIGSEKQLSIFNELYQSSSLISFLDYQIGHSFPVQVTDFDPQLSTAEATLDDGTIVEFIHIQPTVAHRLIHNQQIINATIKSKSVQNGQLYLFCSSPDLPESLYTLRQELSFTIEAIDDEGLPYATLPTGERAYFYGKHAAQEEVRGYLWEKTVRSGHVALMFSLYKLNQEVQFTILETEPNHNTIVGLLANEPTLVFCQVEQKDLLTYAIGQIVTCFVKQSRWENGPYLICSTKETSDDSDTV